MTNIFDYLHWRGDISFECSPFNEIDGLIFSALAYFPFELANSTCSLPNTVKNLCSAMLSVKGIEDKVTFKDDVTLMRALVKSKRFMDMELSEYRNFIDEATQTQFSAITIKIKKRLYCVAFRGTDSSLVGWKEDFNMAFLSPVPAQISAAEYLHLRMKKNSGKFILCGHSKGGNLAIYSAVFSKASRIKEIYSYDAPGFDGSVFKLAGYKEICTKIFSFVPEFSIVGMLLNHENSHKVVNSNRSNVFQHVFYSWEVSGKNFVYLDATSKGSKFIDTTIKDWLSGTTKEERKLFVDTVFSVLAETKITSLRDIGDNWFQNAKAITKSLHSLDAKTKSAVNATLQLLFSSAKKNALPQIIAEKIHR